MSAAISHDVRQPLGSVVASGRAGLNWLAADPPNIEAARRSLGRVLSGGQRAAEILDRAKSFTRKSPPKLEIVAVNAIIVDTIAVVEPVAQQRGIALRAVLDGQLEPALLDRVQIQQVIMNLVMNAIDAMTDFPLETREIEIRSWLDGLTGVTIEVRDSGPGVSDEQLSRLFDPFYTTKAEGMGMGLAICKNIVEDHGGKLWVAANEPRGAVFGLTVERWPVENAYPSELL